MPDAPQTTVEQTLPEGLVIHRYEHGGGRIFFKHGPRRDLVIDLYDDAPGTRRDAIINILLASGVLVGRKDA